MEYAECEAVVKDYPPFQEAMKKRGIEDMDLVMVDPWLVAISRYLTSKFCQNYFSYTIFFFLILILEESIFIGVWDIIVKLMLLAADLLNR